MLRVITVNTNGIRSAFNKGFLDWMTRQKADFVCIQELKAQLPDLSEKFLAVPGYDFHAHYALRKGYSGVAIYSRHKPLAVKRGIGVKEFDNEGRYLQLDFENLSLVSVYFPSGSMSDERQQSKFRFLKAFLPYMRKLKKSNRQFLLCGDVNIAHKEIDIKNWRGNLNHSGFLPEERAWLTNLFSNEGWFDTFRLINQLPDQYTWWSNRGQARAKNVGWRIDYQIGTEKIAKAAKTTAIYREKFFSDHAPLTIDYDYKLKK